MARQSLDADGGLRAKLNRVRTPLRPTRSGRPPSGINPLRATRPKRKATGDQKIPPASTYRRIWWISGVALFVVIFTATDGHTYGLRPHPHHNALLVGAADSLPTSASVHNGRFVRAVSLDGGVLQVEPPLKRDHPVIRESTATEDIWASPAMQSLRPIVIGYGRVTMSSSLGVVPTIRGLSAWIGFAKPSRPACSNGEPTPTASLPLSNGYVAVVLGAETGKPNAVYVAQTELCGAQLFPPVASAPARMIISVRWTYAGHGRVSFSLPSCGASLGTNRIGSRSKPGIAVEAEVPIPGCSTSSGRHVETPIKPESLASIGARLLHARLGPVPQVGTN